MLGNIERPIGTALDIERITAGAEGANAGAQAVILDLVQVELLSVAQHIGKSLGHQRGAAHLCGPPARGGMITVPERGGAAAGLAVEQILPGLVFGAEGIRRLRPRP